MSGILQHRWIHKELFDVQNQQEIARDQHPYRDGSGRELLPSLAWSRNLKRSAPFLMRSNYALFKTGQKATPLKAIMSAITAETQYALLMDWYRLQGIDRPAIHKCERVSKEDYLRIRELRKQGMPYRKIGQLLGRHHDVVRQHCKDMQVKTEKKLLNEWSLKLFGCHFSTLASYRRAGIAKQERIRELIKGII
jgi:DNA-binding CsgD family transcriptional regulator